HALFTPNIVQSANTLKLILSFVALDKGITLLPASIEQQIPHPNLVYRPLHPPTKPDTLTVIRRKDQTLPTLTGLNQTLKRD
ncbi:MAG: LysR substrate-binding domain-containing protein, partial [Cyanobacteria bacterium J06650_10]